MNAISRDAFLLLGLCVVGFSIGGSGVIAGEISWTNSAGGEILEGNNWSGTSVPGSDDQAVFSLAILDQVDTNLADDISWQGLRVNATTLEIALNGKTLDLSSSDGSAALKVSANEANRGSLWLKDGTVLASGVEVGVDSGEDATFYSGLTITGNSATLKVAEGAPPTRIVSREDSTAWVHVSAGAQMVSPTADLILEGPGIAGFDVTALGGKRSSALIGGKIYVNSGSLSVGSLGDVISSKQLVLGSDDSMAKVSAYGGGQLTTAKGDSPESWSAVIGPTPGSDGRAHFLSHAKWNQDGTLAVGARGKGRMVLETAASAQAVDLEIGAYPGSHGFAGVVDVGSLLQVDDSVYVGGRKDAPGGYGELVAEGGGILSVGKTIHLWGEGWLHSFKSSSTVSVGQVENPKLNMVTVGTDGTVSGLGKIDFHVENLDGTVAPGAPFGTMTVSSLFSLGNLNFQVGRVDGQAVSGMLAVQKNATLGGTLHVSKAEGYEPQVGDTFTLLRSSKLSGDFETLDLFPLGPGLSWSLAVESTAKTSLILSVLGSILVDGDINGDGKVDLTDFGTLKANFGQDGGRSQGDLNGDATINLTDFGILKANFGRTGSQVVPEPSALALFAAATVLFAPLALRPARKRC